MYPITLPCPLLSGNSNATSSTFKRSTTPFDKQQRRFSRGSYTANFSAVMTTLELQEFRAWYLTEINEMETFEADWEVEGIAGTKKFKFLEAYNVSSYEYGLHHVSAPVQVMTNYNEISLKPPISITDFNASDDIHNEIIMTWTNDIQTLTYDLYEDNISVQTNIDSGYSLSRTDGIVRTYKLNQIAANSTAFSNEDFGNSIAAPISITDFNASDDQINEIIMTWTNDIQTLTYDLYEDNILIQSNITSGYSLSRTDDIIRSYKIDQINIYGSAFSNEDFGNNVQPPAANVEFDTDLTGNVIFTTSNGDCQVDKGDGTYVVYSAGIIDIIPTGTVKILFGTGLNKISFYDNGTATTRNRFTSIVIDDFTQITSMQNFAWNLTNLVTFQSLNLSSTSNVTIISSAFDSCSSLTSFPAIDTSSVTFFDGAFDSCFSLTSFPAIDTSSAVNLQNTWNDCNNLTSFPAINTSLVVNFTNTFNGCNNLTSFPGLNISRATSVSSMFADCTLIESIGGLIGNNFSSGTDFSNMFLNCTSLICLTSINTENNTNTSNMFNNTPSLVNPVQFQIDELISPQGKDYTNGSACP